MARRQVPKGAKRLPALLTLGSVILWAIGLEGIVHGDYLRLLIFGAAGMGLAVLSIRFIPSEPAAQPPSPPASPPSQP